MTKTFDKIVRGGTVVTHEKSGPADIGIRNERIAEIGDLGTVDAGEVIDARGLTVLPGVIDTQVHFREPGNEHKEDLESGSVCAVMGGVVAVFEMPNTKPPTTTEEAIKDKLTRAKRMWCDHAFYVGAADENAEHLKELEMLPGTAGVKVFMGASTGSLLVQDDETLLRVLKSGKRRVAIHAEDEYRMEERKDKRVPGDPSSHPVWRDKETAFRATKRIVSLARQTGRPIHVLHVTTGAEMKFLREARDIATVEVLPQHLTLSAPECYNELGTYAQMNPPIRDKAEQEALWEAVNDGTVFLLGSDHAPHTKEEKAKPYPESPSGMPGVQTLLPLMLDHLNAGRLTLKRLIELTSLNAHRIFGLTDKGLLAEGMHADLTLVDMKARWTIEDSWLKSRCGWSPFSGRSIAGKPIGTIIRGHRVMWDAGLVGTAGGIPIRFDATNA